MFLTIRDLSFVTADPLFAGLSFTLAKRDRLGLVAANGRGKSTLFRLLMGAQEATSGEITRARNLKLALVAQDVPPDLMERTLIDILEAARPGEEWRAAVLLDDLQVPWETGQKRFTELSGGWQRIGLLALAMTLEPDLLLLDEPTNHLDLSRIAFLERTLAGLDVAMIIASHDRAFLDAATNRTLFLRPMASPQFALPYSAARKALEEVDAAQVRQFDNDLRRAGELRKQASKLKNIGINSGSDLLVVKTKQLTERAEKIEAAARPAHVERSAGAIRLSSSEAMSKAIVTLNDVQISTPDGRNLFKTGQKWITAGDRVVLLGPNGSGKTQLVQAVRRAFENPGAIRVAPSARLGFSDQALSGVDLSETPFDAITTRFDLGDQAAHAVLAGAGITMVWQRRKVADLSGGQRARLAMLVLRLTRPSFYLLDEPTNHLDIEGQEALEDELQDQTSAALIVSHDRSFIRGVGTRFWVIEGRRLNEVDSPEAFFAAMTQP
jgi:ATPase subunit of ABC transporter with duplicated ATPase domains